MSSERRRHQRYSIMAHVRVTCGTVNHILDVTNISLSGVFVSTLGLPPTAEFRTGQPIELNIFLSESTENVRVFGRIVRTVKRDDPPASGFGVEFDNVDDRAQLGISLFVELARSSEAPGPPPLPTSKLGR
jgi:c-di-GMP-binding flagellar brake protein YcgR